MTIKQENKDLLLKDLCQRLPYRVKVKVECTTADGEKIKDEGVLNSIFINEFGTIYVCVDEIEYELEDVKPYLRTMSSMTEEEREALKELTAADIVTNCGFEYENLRGMCFGMMYIDCQELIDWLNAHHFDYRGLIEKGLAIEVAEDNNPYKD